MKLFGKRAGFIIHRSEWVVTVIHLAAWAQIGVIIRAFLGKLLELGCGGNQWGPCLAGGVYFKDLPANMLGSFIIGLVGTSDMLGIADHRAVGLLPADHMWQANIPLQTGVRTGLCGSITTFSSWMLETMTTAIQNNLWMNAIGMIIVGLYCSIISYVMGTHLALFIDKTVNKEPVLEEQVTFKEEQAEAALGLSTQQASLSELEDIEPDIPVLVPLSEDEMISSNLSGHVERIMEAKERLGKLEGRVPEQRSKTSGGEKAKWTLQVVDVVIVALLVCITVATSCGVAYEIKHVWLRQIWLALLLGPFGCLCRWLLSRLNYQIEGDWKWFPLGTFIANILAATIDFCLQAVLIRTSPAYWGTLVINSIELGFCGCMSTVSTLITEIVAMSEFVPASLRAYKYSFLTFVGTFVWALCIYGWVFWT